MAEIVYAHITCELADKCSFSVIDSLGYAYDQIRDFLKSLIDIVDKFVRIKCHLRQIDQHRIISLELACKNTGRSQPSRMASHDLHDRNRLLIIIHRCIDRNLPHCRGNVFCRAAESRRMVCTYKIIVYRLGDSHKSDITACFFCIPGQFAHRIHGIISTNIEEISNPVLLKFFKQPRVDFIPEIFRKLVPARSQIRSRSGFDQLQLSRPLQRLHIHDLII